VSNISRLSISECNELFLTVQYAIKKIKKFLSPKGFIILLAEGKIAGQTEKHMHVHVIPRFIGDNVINMKRKKAKNQITDKKLLRLLNTLKSVRHFTE
jgi:diadenosine tetraphosphate (Ap4A) HIT family hydrolase